MHRLRPGSSRPCCCDFPTMMLYSPTVNQNEPFPS
ncbi:rCG37836, partial [Rattus norvegicus]